MGGRGAGGVGAAAFGAIARVGHAWSCTHQRRGARTDGGVRRCRGDSDTRSALGDLEPAKWFGRRRAGLRIEGCISSLLATAKLIGKSALSSGSSSHAILSRKRLNVGLCRGRSSEMRGGGHSFRSSTSGESTTPLPCHGHPSPTAVRGPGADSKCRRTDSSPHLCPSDTELRPSQCSSSESGVRDPRRPREA